MAFVDVEYGGGGTVTYSHVFSQASEHTAIQDADLVIISTMRWENLPIVTFNGNTISADESKYDDAPRTYMQTRSVRNVKQGDKFNSSGWSIYYYINYN